MMFRDDVAEATVFSHSIEFSQSCFQFPTCLTDEGDLVVLSIAPGVSLSSRSVSVKCRLQTADQG